MIIDTRCPSGIPGFDNLCEGGFVRESMNCVLGGPGAGKTIFLLQFLYQGLKEYKEKGLYVSFEPDTLEIFKDANRLGWNFEKLDAKGEIKFVNISPETTVLDLKREVTNLISKYDVKRICFDPINLFTAAENNNTKIRINLVDIVNLLKRLNVTVLVSNESDGTDAGEAGIVLNDIKTQYIKFLSDGLIELYSSGLGGITDRALRIVKMRRTNHVRGPVPMQIKDNGINILSSKNNRA